jgi:hypothetical protein
MMLVAGIPKYLVTFSKDLSPCYGFALYYSVKTIDIIKYIACL